MDRGKRGQETAVQIGRAILTGIAIFVIATVPGIYIVRYLEIVIIPGVTTGKILLSLTAFGAAVVVLRSIYTKKSVRPQSMGPRMVAAGGWMLFCAWAWTQANRHGFIFTGRELISIMAVLLITEAVIYGAAILKLLQAGNSTAVKTITEANRHLHPKNLYRGIAVVAILATVIAFLEAPLNAVLPLMSLFAIAGAASLKGDKKVTEAIGKLRTKVKETPLSNQLVILMVILFLAFGTFLRIYDLDQQSFHADEFNQLSALVGFSETGEYVQWDFVNEQALKSYNRSKLYTRLASWSIDTFGVNEFGARIPGALVSSLSILLLFFVVMYFFSTRIALWSTAIFAFYPVAIYYARYTRNYSVTHPLFLILIVTGYKTLQHALKISYKKTNSHKPTKHILPFFLWGALSLALFALSVNLNSLTLNLVPAFLVAAVALVVLNRKKISLPVLLAGTGVIAFAGIAFIILNYFKVIYLFNVEAVFAEHLRYLPYSSARPYMSEYLRSMNFPAIASALTILGWIVSGISRNEKQLYFLSLALTPLLLATYFWRQFVDIRYIYVFTPILTTFIAVGITALISLSKELLAKKKWARRLVAIPSVLAFLLVVPLSFPGTYSPPLLQRAHADWKTGDAARVTSRGVSPDFEKAFALVNERWRDGDVLVTTLRQFAPLYFKPENTSADQDIYTVRRDTNDVTLVNNSEFCGNDGESVVVALDQLELSYKRVWIVVEYLHWWEKDANAYIRKNAKNYGAEIGIPKYTYNQFYKKYDYRWPSVFLLNVDKSEPTTPLPSIARCES